MKQAKRNLKDAEYSQNELVALQKFVDDELKGKAEGHVKYIYMQFFKEIKSDKLRKYFTDAVLQSNRGGEYDYLHGLVK